MMTQVKLLIRLVLIRLVLLLAAFNFVCCYSFYYYFCYWYFCCFYRCCCFYCYSFGLFYCSFSFPGNLGPLFFWFLWSPGSRIGLVVGLMVFPGCCYCCWWWCCCWFGWCLMTFVSKFWQDASVVCRTGRMASCPTRPPSSAGPDRLICDEWLESPLYWG